MSRFALPLLLLLDPTVRAQPATPQGVTFASRPPSDGENPWYVGHRAPLTPDPLLKLPVGKVVARGWLAVELKQMVEGMFGNLPSHSQFCQLEGSAWSSKDGSGANGWEELPYWLKGYASLAWLTRSDRDIGVARDWIKAVLASQREDGWFGPESNRTQPDLWPNMPVLWALRTWYEATGDARILTFLQKYFRWELDLPKEKLLPDSWQKVRGGDNLDVVHWLYDRTGEPWLLELAARLHERTSDWTGGIASWHGVNFCQGFREPAQFWVQSRDAKHFDATLRNYAEMMHKFGQVPGGMFGADENCREGYRDPRQGAEACSMVEFMLSFEMLAGMTGDTLWSDRCEEVAFNSLPAAIGQNANSLHYLTSPNLASCDAQDKSPAVENGGCMFAFSPDERYRCCQHNVCMGWPYFTEHQWAATRDRGLAAVMYAPCEVRALVGDGAMAQIVVDTNYPFEESVRLRIELDRPAKFPLWLRVPGWCNGFAVVLAGKVVALTVHSGDWVRFEQAWGTSNELELRLPMKLQVRRFPDNGNFAAVDRGPLTWSLKIPSTWKPNRDDHCFDVLPDGPWNYGLEIADPKPESSFAIDNAEARAEPSVTPSFQSSPSMELHAKARRIPEWGMQFGLVAPLQQSPVKCEEPVEEVTLIPMGQAKLRISAFPVIGTGPDARVWKKPPVPPTASFAHDDPFALNDGILPKNSIDHTIPRFTWWDHLGTVEWVQYDWKEPRKLGRAGVYWFDDSGKGRCRVPKSWRLLWSDGKEWREVAHPSGYAVDQDRMVDVTFDAVTATALRLEAMLQPEFSGGILEWTVGE